MVFPRMDPSEIPRSKVLGLGGFHAVVVRAGGLLFGQADVGQVFRARHVRGMAAVQIGVGIGLGVQPIKNRLSFDFLLLQTGFNEPAGLFFGPVAPVDFRGLVSRATSSTHFSKWGGHTFSPFLG